jgi:hypothetical protein
LGAWGGMRALLTTVLVGKSSFPSPFAAFQKAIGSFSTYTTIFTYVLSSLVFTTIYLLSSNPDDQLGILVEGRYCLSARGYGWPVY